MPKALAMLRADAARTAFSLAHARALLPEAICRNGTKASAVSARGARYFSVEEDTKISEL